MPGGAPIGNQNAVKNRPWRLAIERALEKRSKVDQVQSLDGIAEKLIKLAEAGDVAALKELGDRLDGKPAQQLQLSGDADTPLVVSVVKFLDAPDKPSE